MARLLQTDGGDTLLSLVATRSINTVSQLVGSGNRPLVAVVLCCVVCRNVPRSPAGSQRSFPASGPQLILPASLRYQVINCTRILIGLRRSMTSDYPRLINVFIYLLITYVLTTYGVFAV